MRKKGNNQLYGLAPVFYSSGLYYNKLLFRKYNIPEPHNNMNWFEILDLAKRIPNEEGEYGFYTYIHNNNLFDLIDTIAASEGIRYVSGKRSTFTINTPSWLKIWKAVLDAYQANAIYVPEGKLLATQNFELYNKEFLDGNVAMILESSDFENQLDNYKTIEWGLVTQPVHTDLRDTGTGFFLPEIYGINKDSQQKRAAWELIQFINSENLAKKRSALKVGGVTTHLSVINEHSNKEVFYSIKPDLTDNTAYQSLSTSFKSALYSRAQERARMENKEWPFKI